MFIDRAGRSIAAQHGLGTGRRALPTTGRHLLAGSDDLDAGWADTAGVQQAAVDASASADVRDTSSRPVVCHSPVTSN